MQYVNKYVNIFVYIGVQIYLAYTFIRYIRSMVKSTAGALLVRISEAALTAYIQYVKRTSLWVSCRNSLWGQVRNVK